MMKSKWDINKIESKAVKFGTGSHITTPASWTGKTVIAMLKTKWDEISGKKGDESE
jgi:hypothetical protein